MRIKLTTLLLAISLTMMAQNMELPAPITTGGMPLMEALSNRQSTRSYTPEQLNKQQLSNLLWAAWGFNRADKRTAPSSQNKQEMELYVVLESGVYRYDARNNMLIEVRAGDHREKTGKQPFVKEAPVNIIMVADRDKMAPNNEEKQYATAMVNAGYISENIYLYCASAALGTVARGSFDKNELFHLLKLKPTEMVILAQTVGYIAPSSGY